MKIHLGIQRKMLFLEEKTIYLVTEITNRSDHNVFADRATSPQVWKSDFEKSVLKPVTQWGTLLLRLKSHKGIPYTHRWESENNTFQNTLRIFTGLENAFAGPGWTWKYHKSKDQGFLHQNYIQIFSQLRDFFCPINFFSKKIINLLVRKKIVAKSKKSTFWKFWNFGNLFFSILRQTFFGPKNFVFFSDFFWSGKKKFFLGVEKKNWI